MCENYEDIKHFENIQLSIMKFALSLYSILGAPIAAIYAYVFIHKSITDVTQMGLNPTGIIDKILIIGGISGFCLFFSALLNFWRFCKVCKQKCSIILNLIPVVVLLIVFIACFLHIGTAFQ